jgi:hypothetical protein
MKGIAAPPWLVIQWPATWSPRCTRCVCICEKVDHLKTTNVSTAGHSVMCHKANSRRDHRSGGTVLRPLLQI